MMTLYSDDNCTVPLSQNNITLNTCTSKKMYLCNPGTGSKSNDSVSFMVGAATALIAAIAAVLML